VELLKLAVHCDWIGAQLLTLSAKNKKAHFRTNPLVCFGMGLATTSAWTSTKVAWALNLLRVLLKHRQAS
jgi:hypothetical protein